MIRKSMLLVVAGLVLVLASFGCGKSESGGPGGAAAQVSGLGREAENAAGGLAAAPIGHLSELVTRLPPRQSRRRRGFVEAAQ